MTKILAGIAALTMLGAASLPLQASAAEQQQGVSKNQVTDLSSQRHWRHRGHYGYRPWGPRYRYGYRGPRYRHWGPRYSSWGPGYGYPYPYRYGYGGYGYPYG